LVFRFPKEIEIRNKQNFRHGVDIRGEGGYIVAAPSVHPSGYIYNWPYGMTTEPAEVPKKLIELIKSNGQIKKPEEILKQTQENIETHKEKPEAEEIELDNRKRYDRARAYLDQIPPAIQGQGGHDSLLWAARCLVTGFELSDADTFSLLEIWNQKCIPPWDMSDPKDQKDFLRKINEAKTQPFGKSKGWLLDETDLLPSLSDEWAIRIVANDAAKDIIPATIEEAASVQFKNFPTDAFPPPYADFIRQASKAYCVDECIFGMSMLVVAGAAMGNAFRLHLKGNFEPPPILWFGFIASSGQNKTAPLNIITDPLNDIIPASEIVPSPLVCVHRMVLSNATVEALLARLSRWPRGGLCHRDEMAGWIKSFDVYKGGRGSDEQDWLQFWNGDRYILDRKTDNEEVIIPAASISFLGGIQPKLLPDLFTPTRLASGLIPRILVAHPPKKDIFWTDIEIGAEKVKFWADTIRTLRLHPYKALDTMTNQLMPNILQMEPEAKYRFIDYYNSITKSIRDMNEFAEMFASKARSTFPRFALPLHAFRCIFEEKPIISDVSEIEMDGAIQIMRWALNEQFRVYGLASQECMQQEKGQVLQMLQESANADGIGSVRDVYRRKNMDPGELKSKIETLIRDGKVEWLNSSRRSYKLK